MDTTKDSAGKEYITSTQLIARTYRGEKVRVDTGDGVVTVTGVKGRYSVDGGKPILFSTLQEWIGIYHYEFSESVFIPG
jgi:hypothetical protein